ncbi:MAG: RNA polymerase sigma factor RpoD/SigA [Fibrobacterota bacterium]
MLKYKVLSDEEEKEIIRRIQSEDEKAHKKALDDLVMSNLRFVISVARKYRNNGLSFLDLINEGNLGLYKAARKFNSDKNVKFISYAVWWIRQSIQKALFDQANTMKIPPNKLNIMNKFKRALDKNRNDFHATISLPEFKDHEKDIIDIIDKTSIVSLDLPLSSITGEEGSNTLMDLIGEPAKQAEEAEKKEMRSTVNEILDELSAREARVIRMYYGINEEKEYTLEEIGRELALTRERVRQIKNKALRKLFRCKALKNQLHPEEPEEES